MLAPINTPRFSKICTWRTHFSFSKATNCCVHMFTTARNAPGDMPDIVKSCLGEKHPTLQSPASLSATMRFRSFTAMARASDESAG